MKTIARLAAAVAVVAAAALVGPGCRGSDPPQASADPARAAPAEPPASRVAEPAPSATPSAATPSAAAPSAAPAAPAPTSAAPSKDYAGDIAKLCEVVQLSGAEAESPDDRRLPVANWLAANLTTSESRQFLAKIQPLVGAGKADALDAEARRVGLASCSLAAEWRAPPTR